ncbi:sugar ABC transporter substrate-binding protein [Kushneria phosphatilytica]|uniref:Sugar ABC transporter substrate-binding protein n=1 Tax=Kushneria phosphatilytica TaxID=657387 RepID=A0A5C0ZW13_9GAMM|nr:sugar ABC transporter substrate-binding protein [Kushneria phosphatilytica]QEL10054.1 sugar ABC transporter substrate-binding protein [Kushneria phosphatilytica]
MSYQFGRRDFLKGLGGMAGLSLMGAGAWRTALASQMGSSEAWQQASGTTLQFISENTPPTSAIAANLEPFKKLTGINVNITEMQLGALVQKVALDFGSGRSAYDIIYADPYQVVAPYHQGLVDLNRFIGDDSLPSIPKGVDDFIPTQLAAAGRFGNREELYTLPYDCPTMIWIYRKDLFDKYHDQMQQDLGFAPTPSADTTWEQYYQIAKWFNGDTASEVKYGTGHQAQQYDSLMCDFSNVLFAYGGDYFANGQQVGLIGTDDPGPCQLENDASMAAAEFYRKLLKIAHPGSTSWDWTGVANAFQNGEFAMMPEWHEFAGSLESSDLKGKVGYAPLPKGPARSANLWGGTGIGINANASEDVQKAAWLFLVWATSPQTQLAGLKSDVGGGTPTRQSVYDMPEVKKASHPPTDMPNMLTADTMLTAWQDDHIGLRPKIPQWNEVDTVIFTQLSKMLAGQQDAAQTMKLAKQRIDRIVGA